eukprot:350734-Chlamydomonas_euryale.AAC.1
MACGGECTAAAGKDSWAAAVAMACGGEECTAAAGKDSWAAAVAMACGGECTAGAGRNLRARPCTCDIRAPMRVCTKRWWAMCNEAYATSTFTQVWWEACMPLPAGRWLRAPVEGRAVARPCAPSGRTACVPDGHRWCHPRVRSPVRRRQRQLRHCHCCMHAAGAAVSVITNVPAAAAAAARIQDPADTDGDGAAAVVFHTPVLHLQHARRYPASVRMLAALVVPCAQPVAGKCCWSRSRPGQESRVERNCDLAAGYLAE